jgi:hypothetical protein
MSLSDNELITRFPSSPAKSSLDFLDSYTYSPEKQIRIAEATKEPEVSQQQIEKVFEQEKTATDGSICGAGSPTFQSQRFQVFTEDDFGNTFIKKKSRLCVLQFPTTSHRSKQVFVDELVQKIASARGDYWGGYGFPVKRTTFFMSDGKYFVGFVSWDALSLQKWSDISRSVGALHAKVYYKAGVRDSFFGMCDMFPDVRLEKLLQNAKKYNKENVRKFQ